MRKLRLAVEFITEPVWEIFPDGGVDEIDPKELPISDELKRDLCAWAAQLHATYDSNYPTDSHFSTQAEEDEFCEQGPRLWKRLQQELNEDFLLEPYKP